MYRIAIGDDDLQFLKDFKAIVSRCMEAEHLRLGEDYAIDCYPSAPPLMSALKARKDRYQLILLDVRFGPDNGLTMAATLRESGAAFSLIYVTNHRDYVFNSFDTRPLHYLLKPVNEEKLSELVREDYRRRYQDVRLYLKSGARHTSLAFQNIVAVEAALHRVFLHLRDGTSAEWNGTLKELAPQLPGWCFCRCHNSYFVNLAHVTEMVRYEARLDNGKNIPISKRYYKPAIEHYIAFLKI
ncbi:MAG: response regulator transcription factor [Oscillospiraceae bacterium]|nr:response regulator transcription factor [Oscillospiraceae bacterium]